MQKETLGRWRNIIFSSEEAFKIREIVGEKRIVFCTGCYDILQSGHPIFFEQCKKRGDVVVVGLGLDSTLTTLKGKDRPINNQENRAYLLASLKDVDYVVFNNSEIGEGKIDFNGVIRLLKPDVFVLNEDDSGIEIKRRLCKELGIELALVRREIPDFLEATSTTKIIEKIKSL